MTHTLTPQQKLLGESWGTVLGKEFEKEYMQKLSGTLKRERELYQILPSSDQTFNAYKFTTYESVRVIIIGQDPYPQPGYAHGLAFSVPEQLGPTPLSLQHIFEAIEKDIGDEAFEVYHSTDLTRWAKQGVLLLNTVLTVRAYQPGSHVNIGWEEFTTKTIKKLNSSPPPLVFMLWGNHAQAFENLIDDNHHLVLKASHPAARPVHNTFRNCDHFSRCNEFLKAIYNMEIDWR